MRYYCPSLKCIINKFLFTKYLNGETIFLCLEDYLKKHNVPLENITAVATNGAPAVVGHYSGFVALFKEKVPNVYTMF